ncbi:MAG: hypothetical protein J5999_04930 [Oscillospiraceae bacterium]|nr:hypothetical protein [Oscillospiraceae bacterium]
MNKETFKRRIRKITAFAAAMAMSASIVFSDGTFGDFDITVSAVDDVYYDEYGYGTFGNANSLKWSFVDEDKKLDINTTNE